LSEAGAVQSKNPRWSLCCLLWVQVLEAALWKRCTC